MATLAGYETGRSVIPRSLLMQAAKGRASLYGAVIDGTNSYDGGNTGWEKNLRAGLLMARNPTSKLWAPVKRTTVAAASSSSTTLVVANANNFRVGESLIVGVRTGNAITAINYGNNNITLTTAISAAIGEEVIVDGWQTARGVLIEDNIKLTTAERSSTTFVNASGQIAFATNGWGIDQSLVLGDLAACERDFDSASALSQILFDDYTTGDVAQPRPFMPFGFRRIVRISGNRTVVAADNGTLFIADAAATLTLPTLAAGYFFGAIQEANANLAFVSAAGDDIVAINDASADSLTCSTANQLIGAFLAVFSNQAGTKWHYANLVSNAITVAT